MSSMIGLDSKDSRLLTAISRKPQSAASLTRSTGIGRTTVARRLKRLASLHLVQRQKVSGREDVWQMSTSRTRGKGDIHIYRGRDLARAYAYLKTIPKNSIAYAFNGERAVYLGKLRAEQYRTSEIFASYRHRNVLFRTLSGIGVENLYGTLLKKHPHFKETAKNLRPGFSEVELLTTRSSFNGPTIYAATRKCIIIINEEKRVAVVIKESAMVHMFYQICELFFGVINYETDNVRASNKKKIVEFLQEKLFS
jgi:predicted transcriptional regulator